MGMYLNVLGVLSLVQIIYLTEVGTIIIKSEIPLIVLFANLLGL